MKKIQYVPSFTNEKCRFIGLNPDTHLFEVYIWSESRRLWRLDQALSAIVILAVMDTIKEAKVMGLERWLDVGDPKDSWPMTQKWKNKATLHGIKIYNHFKGKTQESSGLNHVYAAILRNQFRQKGFYSQHFDEFASTSVEYHILHAYFSDQRKLDEAYSAVFDSPAKLFNLQLLF